jgi:hypothetical protein
MTFFYVCKEQKLNIEFVNCKILKLMLVKRQFRVSYGLRLWCLTPLSTILHLYRGSQFYL